MALLCKQVCLKHKNIFVNKNQTIKMGIDVYFCKACNIYIKFKEILTKFVNTIFHKNIKKMRCGCCSTKLRVKVRRKQHKEQHKNIQRCACGCGELIKKIGLHGTPIKYKKNHHTRKQELETRTCLFCNSSKSILNNNENKTPNWYKYQNLGFLCSSCYYKTRYKERKKLTV